MIEQHYADKILIKNAKVPSKVTMSDDPVIAFSELVSALYASLTSPQPWHGFLTELRGFMNAKYATLIIGRSPDASPSLMITPSADPEHITAYRDHLFRIDPFTNLPEGEVVSLEEFLRNFESSEFYQSYLYDQDAPHILGVDLRAGSGFETRLRITRPMNSGPYSTKERANLKLIVPHIRQAIELYQRLETSRSEHAVYSGAVEQFAVGTVILDQQSNILSYNHIAEDILQEGDGISLVNRRIAFDNAGLDSEFRSFLKSVLNGAKAAHGNVFRVERPSGKRDLGIVAHGIETTEFLHAGNSPAIALFLGDPERQLEVTGEALRELFELTHTEAKIAAYLANGHSVQESAQVLGIAINTVRAHLRGIFAKTGVRRQSQLVHLIHTSMPEFAGARSGIFTLPHSN